MYDILLLNNGGRTMTMINVEWIDGAYRIECPVCKKRIQSETKDGGFEGGFEPCEHLYIAYLCDSGMYHPDYEDKESVARIGADLDKLKEKVARHIIQEEGLEDDIEEVMEYEVSEQNSVIYLANNLPENMVAYSVDIYTGGCGGGNWTVKNILIFKTKD
jgi:hypothetical protein